MSTGHEGVNPVRGKIKSVLSVSKAKGKLYILTDNKFRIIKQQWKYSATHGKKILQDKGNISSCWQLGRIAKPEHYLFSYEQKYTETFWHLRKNVRRQYFYEPGK